MQDEIRELIRQFQTQELPCDEEYFTQHRNEVQSLVHALKQKTGYSIAWEPPVDLFNFYHLQIPLHADVDVPSIHAKSNQLLRQLADGGRSAAFLHLLISNFSRWASVYWQRFPLTDKAFVEENSWLDDPQSPEEQRLLQSVKRVLEDGGWKWLSAGEGAEVVSEAQSVWPDASGKLLVRHILFPGCSVFE